ncbi:hypothetical protein N7535_001296 [Penicillium sp. DV-2018c]|nr:hypothetical protein N7535_001296 [Penicillium sp. DV-2018c]
MAGQPSAKRARADSVGSLDSLGGKFGDEFDDGFEEDYLNSAIPDDSDPDVDNEIFEEESAGEISRRIKQLDPRSVAETLQRAAKTHPDILGMIDEAIRVLQERTQNASSTSMIM